MSGTGSGRAANTMGLEMTVARSTMTLSERMAHQRETALRVAVAQMAERGYDSVRLRDIATNAGVSIGLLQHYFGTREELLAEGIELHCNMLLEDWQRLYETERDPWRRIVGLIDHLSHSHEVASRAAIWADFVASASRRPELREPLARVYEMWRRLIGEAIDDGLERGIFELQLERDDVVDLVVAQLDGATVALAGFAAHMSPDRMREMALRGAAVLLGHELDAEQAGRRSG
jgi:AcrR family transcriptional regulator